MKIRILALCLLLLCFTSIATAAETYEQDDITYIDYEVVDGYLISTVDLGNIDSDFNSIIVLDSFGEEYVLYINNTKSWGYWTFDITLESPTGTTETQTLKKFLPYATDTDIHIQYFYGEYDLGYGLDVDVYLGLSPLTASFDNNLVSENSSTYQEYLEWTGLWSAYSRRAFSDVQISCSNEFDFKATYVDLEEFEAQKEESLAEWLSGTSELFFDWAWDSILAFVEMIPGVGPYLASALEMSAFIVGEVFFYLDLLFIEYPETTILTIEFLILAATILKTDKKSSIWDMAETYISMHKAVIEFFYNFAIRTIELLVKIVQMVADIVGAIKPL
ncbi:hypothetical protein V7O61_08390 [Methanolobus sp. WCC1]|uniref:hypothetical protein n=1 Tax=unclassified Methanolobus TaxID=2629569 RepID=UPI00324D07D4